MKFEKLNENKIRITLNNQDLAEKNIDFHSFMSNSQESQNLFLDMLNEAEKKVGFITKDYKLRIEALAMSDGNFILTITRFGKNIEADTKSPKLRKVKIQRKQLDVTSKQLIYRFDSFDDFSAFSEFMCKLHKFNNIAKKIVLYFYKGSYYLCFLDLNADNDKVRQLYTVITEFGTYIDGTEVALKKLMECGKLVIKNNAIKTCVQYFK